MAGKHGLRAAGGVVKKSAKRVAGGFTGTLLPDKLSVKFLMHTATLQDTPLKLQSAVSWTVVPCLLQASSFRRARDSIS